MTRTAKLPAWARNNPRDVRFSDLVTLVEALGASMTDESGVPLLGVLHRFPLSWQDRVSFARTDTASTLDNVRLSAGDIRDVDVVARELERRWTNDGEGSEGG